MKILVADDEKNILRIIQFNLEKSGYEVFTAVDGEEALEIINRKRPDLAILDIMMPKINGFDLCKKVKSSDKEINIILLSAKGQEVDKKRGKDAGADLYMTKPFSPRLLLSNINKLLKV